MKPNETNDQARVLCPRTCLDCCCQEHHWGDYGGPDDANGDSEDYDSNTKQCKHCPALLDYTEKCTLCGKELIDHDFDEWFCDPEAGPGSPRFKYAGQPERVCKQVHPWDKREFEPGYFLDRES